MYILFYQKDENMAFTAYKVLSHKLRKCVMELPIFICLFLLPSLAQKLWNGLKDYPVQTLQKLQVSYYLFHLPASTRNFHGNHICALFMRRQQETNQEYAWSSTSGLVFLSSF